MCPIFEETSRYNAPMTKKLIQQELEKLQFGFDIVRRTQDQIRRSKTNQVYVETLTDEVYDSILRDLEQSENKKKIAKRYKVPHNIVMYIWEHYL